MCPHRECVSTLIQTVLVTDLWPTITTATWQHQLLLQILYMTMPHLYTLYVCMYVCIFQAVVSFICLHAFVGLSGHWWLPLFRLALFPQTSLLKAVVLSLPLQPLDYEKKPSYTIEIQVQNTQEYVRFVSSGPKDVATVRLAVDDVDEPPVFKKASYLYEVKEDVAVGTVVGSVSAMDPDRARSIVK